MTDFVPSVKIAFYFIAEEFDLEQVTSRMGMTPDGTRTRDDWPTEYFVKTIWSLEIKEENCIAVSLLFDKLIDILEEKSGVIRNICNDYNIEASFEVTIHCQDGDNPELVLTREIISFAASINAEISFDLYCYEQ